MSCTHPSSRCITLFPAHDYITGARFEIVHCHACGLDITQPQPTGAAMSAYYPSSYYGERDTRRFPGAIEALQRILYRRRAKRVHNALGARAGRVLDVGCGRGWLLQAFRQLGWDVQGTELTRDAASHARDVLGLPVALGPLEGLDLPPGHFNALIFWHVLEHVSNPSELLARAHRLLAPGGVLLIGAPNFGGLEARLCRDKWFHLDVPRHVTHLTPRSLKQILEEAGFETCHWSGFAAEYDCFSLVQSLQNRIGLRQNLLYNLLRGKKAKLFQGENLPRWQIPASLLLAAPLGMLSVPATLILGLIGQAGTMTTLARKLSLSLPPRIPSIAGQGRASNAPP